MTTLADSPNPALRAIAALPQASQELVGWLRLPYDDVEQLREGRKYPPLATRFRIALALRAAHQSTADPAGALELSWTVWCDAEATWDDMIDGEISRARACGATESEIRRVALETIVREFGPEVVEFGSLSPMKDGQAEP